VGDGVLAALFGGLGWEASLVSAHSIANRQAPRAGHASMERARVAERAGRERVRERSGEMYGRGIRIVPMYGRYERYLISYVYAVQCKGRGSITEEIWVGRALGMSPISRYIPLYFGIVIAIIYSTNYNPPEASFLSRGATRRED
jgi:hypothetical protein